MLREALYVLGGFILLAYVAEWALGLFDDAREPPCVAPRVPLVGHLLGLMQHGTQYYTITSQRTDAEMYTLRILNMKLYVANARRLTAPIQKASKTLSFRPFMQLATKKMTNVTDETYDLFGTDMIDHLSHTTKMSLSPGVHLDEQNLRMGNRVLQEIADMVNPDSPAGPEHNLLEWVKHAVIQATGCGVYGKKHPYLDPEVEQSFWEWQTYIPLHLVGIDITGKGYKARKKVQDAVDEWCKDYAADCADVVVSRARTMREAGVVEEDINQQIMSFGIAAYSNTTPTLYWAIYELFSRPELLQDVRAEVISNAVRGSKAAGFGLDVSALKTKCPLLLGVLQEMQRTRHIHAIIRKVTADTLLDGKFFLKAGNYVQMPGQPIHKDATAWGSDAQDFNPYRFVPKDGSERRSTAPPGAFQAWGAAPHLCPARQFATTEMLLVMGLLAVRTELIPTETGQWERNPAVALDFVTIYNPKKDVKVFAKERSEWAGEWSLEMGQSKTQVPIASG